MARGTHYPDRPARSASLLLTFPFFGVPLLSLLALAAFLPCAGCNDLGISDSNAGGGSAGAIAALLPPRPSVFIDSPVRASFLSPGTILVEGIAVVAPSADAPLQRVEVNGQAVPLNPDGTFEATMTLVPGLNVIDASVVDSLGREGHASIGVLAGDYTPLGQPVRNAIGIRLNEKAFGAVESIVDSVVAQLDFATLLAAPILDDQALGGAVRATAFLRTPTITGVKTTLDARPDGLHLTADLLNPRLIADATAVVFGATIGPEFATVTADVLTLNARARVFLYPDERLGFELTDLDVSFQNFQAAFAPGTFIQAIAPLLQGLLSDLVANLLVDSIDRLKPQIDQGLLDGLTPQIPFDLMGTPFLFEALGEVASHDDDGLELVMRFDMPPVPGTLSAAGAAAPGSFSTAGAMPSLVTTRGIIATLDDDMINRLFHGVWAAGLFEQDLSTQLLLQNQVSIGATGTSLTAAELMQFLPELVGHIPRNATLGVRIDAGLPPILNVTGIPDLLRIEMGELYLDLTIDRGNGFETLFKVAVHLTVGASAAISPQGIQLSSARNAKIDLEVLDEPIVRIDERRVRVVLGLILGPLIPRIINQVPLVPIPFTGQLSLIDLDAVASGPNGDHLSLEVDMTR